MKKFAFVVAAMAASVLLLAACAVQEPTNTASRNPVRGDVTTPKPPTMIGVGVNAIVAPSISGAPQARYVVDADPALAAQIYDPFPPTPKKKKEKHRYVGLDAADERWRETLKATQSTIESIDTPTNITNTGGSLFIPADPHGAAGPNHLVTVANVSIEFLQKNGTVDLSTSLANFFTSLTPANFTFDPKVLYDQYEDRFVVVTLERTDIGNGDASNTSNVLVAVSDDSNPNGTWTFTRINVSENISGDDHWLDYPGFAVDEEAVYISGNMFQYFGGGTSAPGSFGGVRMVIIDKGVSGGFYDGYAAVSNTFNPIPGGLVETTTQPAHTYGTVPAGVGTWLMGAGLSGGASEFYQVIRVDDPLGTPTFTGNFINIGDIDNSAAVFPDGAQAGTATNTSGNIGVSTNDRRALDAVWRNDSLWVSHSFRANSGVDSGDVTAGWGEVDTTVLAAPILSQRGGIGGEDIAAGAFTFFPSLAVNDDGGLMVGFSATEATINPGAYFAYRSPGDAAGTTRSAISFRTGQDYYQRRFSGADNRWGDYTATVVDPDEACFWIYNKYAITRGSSTGVDDDGRWGTAFAHFCNDAPVGNTDTANVDNGGTVTVLTTTDDSVLDNDTDADATDTLSTSVVSAPDHATAFILNTNGTFSYTHDGGADLTDVATYRVCDDGSPQECADTTLSFTIAPGANTTPDTVADSATVAEGGTTSTVNGSDTSVLDNDSDPEMDTLTVTTTPVVAPTEAASFSLNANGTFSYTHDGGETTTDSFTYEVCDDGTPQGCSNALVTITITEVNDPISVSGETLADVAEDAGTQSFAFTTLLSNDSAGSGEMGQTLLITAVSNPTGGTVGINGSNVEFTPTANFNGAASFTYTVTDNGTTNGVSDFSSADATASFTITEVNDPVSVSGETLADVAEDDDAQIISFASLLANDNAGPGESGQTLTITAVSSPTGGSVSINGSNVEFTPTVNFNGAASFDYTVTDNGTTNGASDASSADATASFTITEVNDPVSATGETLSDVAEDAATQTYSFASLLDNDSAGEAGQTLTITAVSSPVGGSVAINGSNVEFTPGANFNGAASFDYTVIDNGTTAGAPDPSSADATASLTITEVNDPVSVVGETLADVAEDAGVQTYTFASLLDNDSAGDVGQTLTISAVSNPMGGSVVINGMGVDFTPNDDFSGAAGFTYTVIDDGTTNGAADPSSANAVASLTVTEVNDAPMVSPESLPDVSEDAGTQTFAFASLLANDNAGGGEAGQALTVTVVSNSVGGSAIINGMSVDFSPSPNFSGPASFAYTVTDDGTTNGVPDPASSNALASFTITEVNDPVTANGENVGTVSEDAPTQTYPFNLLLANDSAGDAGQTITVTAVSSPVGGSVAINGSNVEFTPAANFNGAASFDYTVTDDGTTGGSASPQSAEATASLTVTEVNDPVIANGEVLENLMEDPGVQSIPFATLLANDSPGVGDDGQTLTITGVSGGVGGSVVINGTNVDFSPNLDFNGAASFTYTITDNGTTNGVLVPASSATSATFTITEVNDPPVAVADDLGSFLEGMTPVTIDRADLLANDDPGGSESSQVISLLSVSSPVGGSVSISGSTIEFVPDIAFIGRASFSYTIEDDGTTNGVSDPQQDLGTAGFEISSLNGPPQLIDDEFFTDTNQTLADDVSLNDSDPEGDPLTYSVAVQPVNGTLELSDNGSFMYTPSMDFNGVDQFVYEATDGNRTSQATVSIRVGDVLFVDGFETTMP